MFISKIERNKMEYNYLNENEKTLIKTKKN